ncbi:MAG: tetratricopeptide repeat-containing sensor histidine kinase [Bacteroidota bacterium]|nr:tetratricopeptide repeat-containing sensor histidine kinase [Bacteroidota bacterium]
MKKILLCLLLLPGLLRAQYNPDNLLTLLGKSQTPSQKVDLHCKLSKQFQISDIKSSKKHAGLALSLANQFNLKSKQAEALTLLGHANLVLGEYDQALDCHFKSLDLALQGHDTLVMVASYSSLGVMYHKIKDPNRSFSYYEKAKALAIKINDSLGLSKVYNNLGNLHEDNKEYDKAFNYFSKAASMQRLLGRSRSLAISLHNMGNVHIYLPHPEQGLPYLFESLNINQSLQNKILVSGTLGSISQIYKLMGKKDKALEYARESYSLALKTESSKKIRDAAILLQNFYAEHGNYNEAYKYLKTVNKQDSLLNLDHQKLKAAEITAEHEKHILELQHKKSLAEKESQVLKIKKQQIILAFSAATMFLLSVLLMVVFRSRQRFKASSEQLREANNQMVIQNKEIKQQRAALYAQSQILQKQNTLLESLNSFKTRIFSIISHDLRTPFGSIKSILTLINTNTLSQKDLSTLFTVLSTEIDHSMEMMESLLLWSKTQLSGSNVVLKSVQVHRLVADNLQLLASNAEQKGILLLNSVPENTQIQTDQERLNFIIRNLIQNAIKFTSSGGLVKIEAEEQANKVNILVSDTGKGISSKNLSRLFTEDRFTTMGTLNEKGSGLGLMLCKELMESVQGRIQVESQEGQGSTFIIVLPKASSIEPLLIETDNLILN